jgi:hypothetical protein
MPQARGDASTVIHFADHHRIGRPNVPDRKLRNRIIAANVLAWIVIIAMAHFLS